MPVLFTHVRSLLDGQLLARPEMPARLKFETQLCESVQSHCGNDRQLQSLQQTLMWLPLLDNSLTVLSVRHKAN